MRCRDIPRRSMVEGSGDGTSAAFRFARRHGDLADRSGRLRRLRQQRLPQQNSDRNGSRQDDQSGPHFRNARDVEWSRVRKPHSPISAPWVAQKIKRQHHRIDERLQGLGCAVVVVRSLATTTRFGALGASAVFGGKGVG